MTLTGADCAEDFVIANAATLEPGTVVVFGSEGIISESTEPYNKRVAGVISGAENYRPGVILGRKDKSSKGKAAVALIGRVYCKVDSSYSPIEIGDMLTTSPTSGFAMKATDPYAHWSSHWKSPRTSFWWTRFDTHTCYITIIRSLMMTDTKLTVKQFAILTLGQTAPPWHLGKLLEVYNQKFVPLLSTIASLSETKVVMYASIRSAKAVADLLSMQGKVDGEL